MSTQEPTDDEASPAPRPYSIDRQTCGWCGDFASRGPFDHPDYDASWYLCEYCAENVDGMEPALDEIPLEGHVESVVVSVGGEVVARYPYGTFPERS